MFSLLSKLAYRLFLRGVEIPFPQAGSALHQAYLKGHGYYSQCGQDQWILESIFENQPTGFFVDIGAHDGITFSNTLKLEQSGWNGVAFEPNPSVFEKLHANRNCECIHSCVSSKQGTVLFRKITGYSEMLSGMVSTYAPKHLQRMNLEINLHQGAYEDIEVPSIALHSFFTNKKINVVDYMSMDVEGGELDILKSIDFSSVLIKVIGIENNYHDWRIPFFLRAKGYTFHSIVGDEFYIHHSIAANLH